MRYFRKFLINVIGYIDDIMVYSASFKEHVRHVRTVLSHLQRNRLYVKQEKCEFHCNNVMFLGYVISPQWRWRWTNLRSKLSRGGQNPLRGIRHAKTELHFGPILGHPDPDQPFIVEVDVSSCKVGAVLSQRYGTPSKLHPCAFYSRKLTLVETNYDVGKKELLVPLSIKAALEEWRHWLEGACHPFLVLTDQNMEYLKGAKRLNSRKVGAVLY
ncbi:hypothetical protein QTP70_017974 [Hemibagrus guttatus]|uniref:ribonuclease H n=1 Tax=Hemibagrus guttatus TaxID=175788 RepID=A0AAE0UZ21_9TELE|nr:hypothetical protein QTP70_017974 [Hemibagrus guttatus]KAK3555444.1 hypothetical protein QTP86_016101 [Hemibagrus guttatus]